MRKYIWKWTEIIENKRKKHTKIESLESKHSFSKKKKSFVQKLSLCTVNYRAYGLCFFINSHFNLSSRTHPNHFQVTSISDTMKSLHFFLYTDFLFISINFVIYKFSTTIKPVNDGIRISLFAANIFDYNTWIFF